ncbi:hypothetical protein L7F22_013177 [Adiantum nelumboides]|nr:hypothetical protein [Adiantum nelumboides]
MKCSDSSSSVFAMADPYEFLLKESTVSSSQEDVLRRIPGWEEKGNPALSPSQADQPLSRLCGTSGSSSSSSDDGEDAGQEREPAFGLQRPLELASPDTQACQEDSYNPAFLSDRERSLSPRACSLFTGLWGSRLITQSQDAVGGISQVGLQLDGIVHRSKGPHESVIVKDHNNFFAEIFNHTFLPSKEQRTSCLKRVSEDYGQASTVVPPVAFGDRSGGLRQIVAPPKLPKKVDHQKNNHGVDFLECGDKSIKHVDSIEAKEHLTCTANQAACKKNEGVVLNAHLVQCSQLLSKGKETCAKDATPRPRSKASFAADGENGHKRKIEEGDLVQKLKRSKEDSHVQEKVKQSTVANELLLKEVEGSHMKVSSQGSSMAGSSGKCMPPPVVVINANSVLENEAKLEVPKRSKIANASRVLSPKSVMDVVMLVSGLLPVPSLGDPDLLSVFMNTGVSLPLPLRDCSGRLICNNTTFS